MSRINFYVGILDMARWERERERERSSFVELLIDKNSLKRYDDVHIITTKVDYIYNAYRK